MGILVQKRAYKQNVEVVVAEYADIMLFKTQIILINLYGRRSKIVHLVVDVEEESHQHLPAALLTK